MASKGNLFGDLIEIANGNVSLAADRLKEFGDFANAVSQAMTKGEVWPAHQNQPDDQPHPPKPSDPVNSKE